MLVDEGSTGSLITEKLANVLPLKVVDAAVLTVKTLNGVEKRESFIYETKVFNHRTHRLDDVHLYGTVSIGKVIAPNSGTVSRGGYPSEKTVFGS